jgi:hypothetical protein
MSSLFQPPSQRFDSAYPGQLRKGAGYGKEIMKRWKALYFFIDKLGRILLAGLLIRPLYQ